MATITWIYYGMLLIILGSEICESNYWNRAYYNYLRYYRGRYGRRSGQVSGKQVLKSVKSMPMEVYNNYYCNIVKSSVGKRSAVQPRIIRNQSFQMPNYMNSNPFLRSYAEAYFGKDRIDSLSSTLRVFFNKDIDPYLRTMVARRQQGYSFKQIQDEVLRGLLSRYRGAGRGVSLENALRAVKTVNKAGNAQVKQHTNAYSTANCQEMSLPGRKYMCSQLEFANGVTRPCGVDNVVTMMYDDCGCGSPDVIIVPVPNPIPNPNPPAPPPAPQTPAPTQVPTPAPPPTQAPSANPGGTTATTTTTTTTSVTQRDCGISALNPARDFPLVREILRQWRVVGGVAAQAGEFPWTVSITAANALCAGSILNATHILTAGHCAQPYPASAITVDVGEHDRLNDNDHTTFNVARVIPHPNYTPGPESNDLAVLELATPIDFNVITDAAPICLPTAAFSATIPDGTECIVAGWGTLSFQGEVPNTLQEVAIPTYAGTSCTANFDTVPTTPNTQLCAGAPGIGGVDSCQGDSGAPLVCPVGGRWVQYGLVSYGDGCANPGEAGVYTDVSQFVSWIRGT